MRYCLAVLLVGCGEARPPSTAADGCYELAVTHCNRLAACGILGTTADKCRADGVAACCLEIDCTRPVRECKSGNSCCAEADCKASAVDVKVFTRCQTAVEVLTCGQLGARLTPTACVVG